MERIAPQFERRVVPEDEEKTEVEAPHQPRGLLQDSCVASSRWTRRELTMLLAFALGTPTVLGAEYVGVTEYNKDVAEKREEQETMESLTEAFQASAEIAQETPSIRTLFGEEASHALTEAVREFPIEAVMHALSEKSGIPVSELVKRTQFKGVRLHTDADLHEMRQMADQIADEETRRQRQHDLENIGFNILGQGLFLNVSRLADATASPQELQERLQDVLMHEFNHSWVGSEGLYADARTKNLYEGLTEAIATRVTTAVHGGSTSYDPVAGYMYGSTALAEVLFASLGERVVFHAYVTGNLKEIQETFDEKYGTKAFDRLLQNGATSDKEQESKYGLIAPLAMVADVFGDKAPTLVEEANRHLTAEQIHLFKQGDMRGVFLVSDLSETGFTNGLLRVEGSDKVALFDNENKNVASLTDQASGVVYVFADLHSSGFTSAHQEPGTVDAQITDLITQRESELRTQLGS